LFVINSYNSINGKNLPDEFTMELAEESFKSVKKYTGMDMVLYVDSWTAPYFRGFKYTDMIITDFPYINDTFWNIGKMYVYSLQNEPFVHIDLDIIARDGFRIPEEGIICEFLRNIEHSDETLKYYYPQYEIPNFIMCSGFSGGTDYGSIYKDNFEHIMAVADREEEACFENLFSAEEVAFTQLVKERKLKISPMEQNTFIHMQGKNKQMKFGNLLETIKLERFNVKF
jgi:hypothetical protein